MEIGIVAIVGILIVGVLLGIGIVYVLMGKRAKQLESELEETKLELERTQQDQAYAREAANTAEQQRLVLNEKLENEQAKLQDSEQAKQELHTQYRDRLKEQQTLHTEQIEALRSDYEKRLKELREDHTIEKTQMNQEQSDLRERYEQAIQDLKQEKTRNEALEASQKEKALELEQLNEQFRQAFENTASKIHEQSVEKLSKEAKDKFGGVLNQFKDKLEEFKKQYTEGASKNQETFGGLREQLSNLQELNQQMSQEAKNLTKALKGESKTQGNWGETLLKKLLEMSGFQEGKHYHHDKAAPNSTVRPDIVVELPENRCVVIDSKVSLTAYSNYVEAEELTERDQYLAAHIKSIENHIKGLSDKNYAGLFDGRSPDFVIMFVPIEPAFMLALQHKHDLATYAFNKKIILVSPTSLLAMLRLLNEMWQRDAIRSNAVEIAEQGGKLVDKIRNAEDSFYDAQKKLTVAVDALGKAESQLYTGRGNLNRQAAKLVSLGVKYKGELSQAVREEQSLLDGGEVDEE